MPSATRTGSPQAWSTSCSRPEPRSPQAHPLGRPTPGSGRGIGGGMTHTSHTGETTSLTRTGQKARLWQGIPTSCFALRVLVSVFSSTVVSTDHSRSLLDHHRCSTAGVILRARCTARAHGPRQTHAEGSERLLAERDRLDHARERIDVALGGVGWCLGGEDEPLARDLDDPHPDHVAWLVGPHGLVEGGAQVPAPRSRRQPPRHTPRR